MTRRLVLVAILAAFTSSANASAQRAGQNVCEREMARASSQYGVPLGMLYAVGLTESGKRGSLQPYAMNIEGRPYFAANARELVLRLKEARQKGAKLIDVGCMQINHHFHGKNFPSVEAMVEPRRNVDYAAQFLKELRQREGSWTMAVARYHAGPNNNPAQKKYVCLVMNNMVATGFGEWTPTARAFCR